MSGWCLGGQERITSGKNISPLMPGGADTMSLKSNVDWKGSPVQKFMENAAHMKRFEFGAECFFLD
jgi:hypothetical protein